MGVMCSSGSSAGSSISQPHAPTPTHTHPPHPPTRSSPKVGGQQDAGGAGQRGKATQQRAEQAHPVGRQRPLAKLVDDAQRAAHGWGAQGVVTCMFGWCGGGRQGRGMLGALEASRDAPTAAPALPASPPPSRTRKRLRPHRSVARRSMEATWDRSMRKADWGTAAASRVASCRVGGGVGVGGGGHACARLGLLQRRTQSPRHPPSARPPACPPTHLREDAVHQAYGCLLRRHKAAHVGQEGDERHLRMGVCRWAGGGEHSTVLPAAYAQTEAHSRSPLACLA